MDDSPLLTPEAEKPKVSTRGEKRPQVAPPSTPWVAPPSTPWINGGGASPSAQKYRKLEKVGIGAYGSVFMAENSETKEIVAIKAASKKEDPIFGGFPVSLLREINILRSVRHENIVQLHEIAQTPQGDPLIVMEFCQASLLELIHSPKHDLSFSEIKYIIRQVLDATGCLHQRGILHRDLATKNVLFNLSGEIKVCDFGISRMAFGQDDDLGFISAKGLEPPNMIVSLPYRAIELLLGESKYGPKLDIWSVGCILAEILLCQTGRRIPFFGGSLENPNKNPTMYVEEIFQILGKPTDETWPNLHKLPLLKTYNTGKISSAKAHKEQGDERAFLRRFFRSQEGKPADTKYCLTESFFELLAGLLTLCPDQRMTAAEALQHAFFTKEKPVPEWHAWHWALASAEIPRGDKKAKVDEDETKKLLKQLSKEELGQGDEEKGQHGHKAVLEKWREQAEKRQQEELKRSSSTKSVKVAEEHQGLQEELSVATAKMTGLEEELIGTRQQVAEAQESQERRMLEFQQATAMLKEHSQKFKQQEARKAQQMVEAVRREEKENMSHLEAELEQSGHEVKRLETEVIKMSDEMTRAMKCVEEQKERDQKEKEVVRERLLELRVQTKGLKEQLAAERARNQQLEVGLVEARRVQEEQLKRLQLLGEEAAEAAGLKQRVLSLESCQHTMGECLKEYQERAREAKEEEQHAKDQVRRLAETLALERRSRN